MRVWMLWHGGSSYSVGEIGGKHDSLEEFDSLKSAKDAFEARAAFHPFYPCVSDDEPADGGPSAWLFFADPRGDHPEDVVGDAYPDRILNFGPRGGLRCEYA